MGPSIQEEFSELSSLRAQLLDYWFSSRWRIPTWNRPLHPGPAHCIPKCTTPCHSLVHLSAVSCPCPLTARGRLIVLKTLSQPSPSLGSLPQFFFQWPLSAFCSHCFINQVLSQASQPTDQATVQLMSLTEMQLLATMLAKGIIGLDICARFSESTHLKNNTDRFGDNNKSFPSGKRKLLYWQKTANWMNLNIEHINCYWAH